jgi:hypothetical protein
MMVRTRVDVKLAIRMIADDRTIDDARRRSDAASTLAARTNGPRATRAHVARAALAKKRARRSSNAASVI